MSYNKNTWQKGDIVTAEKLNHMEDGIASAGNFIVNITADDITSTTGTADKTRQEISDAFNAGFNCMAKIGDNLIPINQIGSNWVAFSGIAEDKDENGIYAIWIVTTEIAYTVEIYHSEQLIEL